MLYLTSATDTQNVTALDQKSLPFTGDLSAVTVTSDQPTFVGVALGAFTDGVAVLTLTQGEPGVASVTVTDGTVTATEQVESYQPVLTTITIGS